MQFARAFQRGHPRSGCSGSSRVELAGTSSEGTGQALTSRTNPPAKSSTKHPHVSSVPLWLRGGGLHKTPKTELFPFILGLPGVRAVAPAPKSVQRAQIKAAQPGTEPRPRARADGSRETFQGAASAAPARGRGGTSPGRQRRGHLGSIVSGVLIVHLELLFRPSHFIHLTYLRLLQSPRDTANTPAPLPSGKEPGEVSQQNKRGRGASPCCIPLSAQLLLARHSCPTSWQGTAGSSWEWDAGTAQHGYNTSQLSVPQKTPHSHSQADLESIFNHFQCGVCKNPGHKILVASQTAEASASTLGNRNLQ
ncbi:uncharacterized protein LOC134555316 [Prinia subflava]|uniref:uncharacterized protein LOC134555316 n=1 Tax=Prinia subflava TaxID=208062 RepID=UPI002FE3819F